MKQLTVGPATHCRGGTIKFGRYDNGEIAITILAPDGSPEATASVNVEPYGALAAGPGKVWLKGWSENDGIPESLEKAGICQRTGELFTTGGCQAELAEFSDELSKDILVVFPRVLTPVCV